jgi:hypothetical protein
MPIEVHAPRDILDRHRLAQAADRQCQTLRELRVRRQKVEPLLSHATGLAIDAAQLVLEKNAPIAAARKC